MIREWTDELALLTLRDEHNEGGQRLNILSSSHAPVKMRGWLAWAPASLERENKPCWRRVQSQLDQARCMSDRKTWYQKVISYASWTCNSLAAGSRGSLQPESCSLYVAMK